MESATARAEREDRDVESRDEKVESQTGNTSERFKKSAEETIERLEELLKEFQPEGRESSAKRSAAGGHAGNHPMAPEERTLSGPAASPQAYTAPDAAAGAISTAIAALRSAVDAEAKLRADPRYERDQKVYELGQAGKLGLVPPSKAEGIAAAAKAGLSPEAAKEVPSTPEEQVADDLKRLNVAEERGKTGGVDAPETKESRTGPVQPGEQQQEPKNNLKEYVAAGANTGDRAPSEPTSTPTTSEPEKKHIIK